MGLASPARGASGLAVQRLQCRLRVLAVAVMLWMSESAQASWQASPADWRQLRIGYRGLKHDCPSFRPAGRPVPAGRMVMDSMSA